MRAHAPLGQLQLRSLQHWSVPGHWVKRMWRVRQATVALRKGQDLALTALPWGVVWRGNPDRRCGTHKRRLVVRLVLKGLIRRSDSSQMVVPAWQLPTSQAHHSRKAHPRPKTVHEIHFSRLPWCNDFTTKCKTQQVSTMVIRLKRT